MRRGGVTSATCASAITLLALSCESRRDPPLTIDGFAGILEREASALAGGRFDGSRFAEAVASHEPVLLEFAGRHVGKRTVPERDATLLRRFTGAYDRFVRSARAARSAEALDLALRIKDVLRQGARDAQEEGG